MEPVIFAGKVFTGTEVLYNQVIHCEKGQITRLEKGSPDRADKQVANLSAGLFDTHINGGRKFYLTQTPTGEGVSDVAAACEAFGTAYTLPTIITSPVDNIMRGIESMRNFMRDHPTKGVIGLHLEGPFLNPVKRGAHLTEYLQKPTDELLEKIIDRGRGVIRLMTIAPELFSDRQLQMLLDSGINIAAGHSNSTFDEAQRAFDAGITLVTHLYNAMSGFNHRNAGLVGACFANDQVYAPIILDGFHSDYSAAGIAYKVKKDKLFLISDALFVGMQVKKFKWGNFDAELRDGRYLNSENNLAGATISLGDGIRNGVKELGIGMQEAVEMATIRPAIALKMENKMGSIAPGFPAVFTCFDDSLETFSVIKL